jgi:hypothetical protein
VWWATGQVSGPVLATDDKNFAQRYADLLGKELQPLTISAAAGFARSAGIPHSALAETAAVLNADGVEQTIAARRFIPK